MNNMILKYTDYIKEGFWSKGIERSKSGEVRNEDKSIIDDYIKTIKWIDLGHVNYLFAEKDYDKPLTLEQIQEIESKLPDNIYIMNCTDLSWIKKRCEYQYKNNDIIYTRNFNSIYFNEYDKMNLYYMEFVEKIISSYHVIYGKNINDKIERVKGTFDSDEYNNLERFYIKLLKVK